MRPYLSGWGTTVVDTSGQTGTAGHLTTREHRRKEQILTQPEPAKVRETASAVVLKQGGLYCLSTPAGDIPERLPHGFGLFFEDCRFLDRYTLTINGQVPTPLSSADRRGFETLHHLANPTLADPGDGRIASNTIAIHRHRLATIPSSFAMTVATASAGRRR
jgi:hypothetical protein